MDERDLVLTLESKRLGTLSDRRFEQTFASMRRAMPDSLERRAIRNALLEMASEHADYVKEQVDHPAGFDAAAARKKMQETFTEALLMGHRVAGAANIGPMKAEILSIASLAESEVEYLAGFVASQKAQEAMDPRARADLYGLAVQGAFYRGMIAVAPPGAQVMWRMTPAEHCASGNAHALGGCIGLEAASPYGKPGSAHNPLPSVPGNGDSRCGGNCRCFLEVYGPAHYRSAVAPTVGIELVAQGGRVVDASAPHGKGTSALFQEMAERIAYFRRLEYLESGTAATEFRKLAEEESGKADRLARSMGASIRFTALRQELIDPIQTAQSHGLKWVPAAAVGDDLVGLVVWLLAADYATSGKVLRVFGPRDRGGPAVDVQTASGRRTYLLDAQGRYILFRSAS